jgi:hypothetical protein
MRNWRQTVLSQYQSSPRLMSLLAAIEAWISPDANYENFYQTVWNIESAVKYGLDVWGRIVNIPRTLPLVGTPTFGFGEAGDRVGFGQGPFFEAATGVTANFTLQDEPYRRLILAKAAFNITDGSVPATNAIMMQLFPGRGNCYVLDGRNVGPQSFGFGEAGDRVGFGQGPFGDLVLASLPGNMTLTYVFQFPLAPFEQAMAQSGVLPKPTGVTPLWSFAGSVPGSGGVLSEAISPFVLSSVGSVGFFGSLAETMPNFALASSGSSAAVGHLVETMPNFTLTSTGTA